MCKDNWRCIAFRKMGWCSTQQDLVEAVHGVPSEVMNIIASYDPIFKNARSIYLMSNVPIFARGMYNLNVKDWDEKDDRSLLHNRNVVEVKLLNRRRRRNIHGRMIITLEPRPIKRIRFQ